MSYWYKTNEDGYCEYDTLAEAQRAADEASRRDKEQVHVYESEGGTVYIAGRKYPTHYEKCMRPDVYGFED